MAAYAEAQRTGVGSVQVDGAMVDVATVRILQGVIDRAALAGIGPTEVR